MAYLTTSMEREFANKNLLLSKAYARELNRFQDNALHRLEHLVQVLKEKLFFMEKNLNEHLIWEVSNEKNLEMVRILDSDNMVTHLAPFQENILGLDMSRQVYCVETQKRKSVYWSNVFISPQTGASTLVLCIPFKKGMIVGHLSLLAVHELIDSIQMAPGGYVAVVDRHGTTIAHHNQALMSQRANLSNHAHIAKGLLGHEGSFPYTVEGKDYIGSVALVPGTGWVVAVSQPLDRIFLPIKNLRESLYIVTLVTFLIAIMAALISLDKMLSPLKKLTWDAQKIAGGNYTIEPLVSSYSEIVELGEDFKTMMEEVKAREDSLRESEKRFRATFEQAAVGIAHVSTDGSFLRINQKFCDIVGYSHQEMLQRTFKEITHPGDLDADLEQFNALLDGKSNTYVMEKRYILKNKELIWVELTVSLVRNKTGKPQWFVSVVQDINERKKAAKKLQEYQERLKALISQLTVAEERERRRIAADLHDHVGQLLAFSRMQIVTMQKAPNEIRKHELSNEISETLLEAIKTIKHVIFELSPPVMNEIGLIDAISDWLEDEVGDRYGIETNIIVQGEKKQLDDDLKTILFRNIRELLTNVVKHAQASQVTVRFDYQGDDLQILVIDNGIGFDAGSVFEKSNKKRCFGLFSTEERMIDLGGTFKIKSTPGKGCKVFLTIPFE